MRSVAVVGVWPAGLSAVRAVRVRGFDGRFVIVGGGTRRPCDRSLLSKGFLAGRVGECGPVLEGGGEGVDARWLLGGRAVGLDRAECAVGLAEGRAVRADGVVVAIGAAAGALPGGHGLEGVHVLRTLDGARALCGGLARGGRVVVVGGGFVGAGVVSAARVLGLGVAVVEAAAAGFAGLLGAAVGMLVCALRAGHGVRFVCAVGVQGLSGDGPGGCVRRTCGPTGSVRIRFAGYAAGAVGVSVEEGAADEGSFLAVCRRTGRPVTVLGVDRARPFVRWRRQPATEAAYRGGSP